MKFVRDDCLSKVKNAILTVAVVAVSVRAFAENQDVSLRQTLYGASFTNGYEVNDQLCDIGATNGTWGVVPSGAAVAEKDTRRNIIYMRCSTPDDGIVFTPYATSVSDRQLSCSEAAIRISSYTETEMMPAPTEARAAFAVFAPEGGETNYMGWVRSRGCWTNLYPAVNATAPVAGAWCDVMVKFLETDGGHDYVEYWLKRESDNAYVALHTIDQVFWVDAGVTTESDRGMFGKIGIVGEGDMERVLGSEPRRGLIVGLGSWYDFLFGESIYNTTPKSVWENAGEPARTRSDELRSYVITVGSGDDSVRYKPSRTHSDKVVEVTEFEVEFSGSNDDDSIPADACARIRMVQSSDESYRFACLVAGQWKTNNTWRVDVDAKYTVEISLDNGKRTVSYRFKDGYGLEGGAYKDLCSGEMLPDASGKTLNIDFDGHGIVHEIRGKDRSR